MAYFYPEDFGAVGDGVHNDCRAIQTAIDNAAENGGGTVVFSSGRTYFSDSVQIRKNVELHLRKGSRLKATDNLKGYIRPDKMSDNHIRLVGNPVVGKPSYAFIYGFEADGCAITGEGVIDGNAPAFTRRKDRYYVTGDFYPRPTVIYIEKSNHITFRDFSITSAPFWSLHPAGCDDVLISGMRILNDLDVANSDGIDPDHCKNVRITGCHIECADDCICLKNTKGNTEYGACENIIISGCTLISTSAAIKIGTEGVSDFRNIIVTYCIISKSNRGISIQIRDGGNVENVTYSDCIIETRRFSPDWWGTAEPIAITALDRDKKTKAGEIKNIRFRNITCRGENGILIHGSEGNSVEDILFENVSVTLSKTTKWDCGLYDLRPSYKYDIEKAKNAGLFMRYADNVTFKNSSITINHSGFYGDTVDSESCNNLSII